MAHVSKARVADTTTTTGTGAITVSGTAAASYRTFSAVCSVGDTFWYFIAHQSADEWEEGFGTYSAANTITRTAVLDSSNAGAAVSFSAGTKDVAITLAASKTVQLDPNGLTSDIKGELRDLPANSQTAAYTLVLADHGKHISITTGGVTVPAGVFGVGDNVTIFNNSGSSQTITQGASVTMRQAGTANTGNRTLAQYGLATVLCVAANTFVISGAGLS